MPFPVHTRMETAMEVRLFLCAHVPIQRAYTVFLRLSANINPMTNQLHVHIDEITVALCGSCTMLVTLIVLCCTDRK